MSSTDDDSDNDIVDFKKPPDGTNIDYRPYFSLKAFEMLQLRRLCASITAEEEFQEIMLGLLRILGNKINDVNALKRWRYDDVGTANYSRSSCSGDSTGSIFEEDITLCHR